MQTNEVLAHTFFKGSEYSAWDLLNNVAGGQALSIISEAFFKLINKLQEANQGYDGEMTRTATQKAAGILDLDQVTTLNAQIDAMQHSVNLQFKKLAVSQASINMVQHAKNWCKVCGIQTHDVERYEANQDSVKQEMRKRGKANKIMATVTTQLEEPSYLLLGQKNQNQNQAQGASQYSTQGVGQQYQNPNQTVNPSVPKGEMTNEKLFQKLMT